MSTSTLPSHLSKLSISRRFLALAALACLSLGCSRTGTVTVESGRPVAVAPLEELVVGTVEELNVAKNGTGVGMAVGGSDHVYDLPTFVPERGLDDQLLDHTYITKPVGGTVRLSLAPAW